MNEWLQGKGRMKWVTGNEELNRGSVGVVHECIHIDIHISSSTVQSEALTVAKSL
jgi:hypothetical protein